MDTSIAIQFLLAAVGIITTIIAYQTKRHYADIDKKIESLQGDNKMMVEQIHQAHLGLAKSATVEDIRKMKDEISREINDLTKMVYKNMNKSNNDD